MAMLSGITAEELRSIIEYNPESGVLTWRARPREHFQSERICKIWNTKYAGKIAGTIQTSV